MLEATNGNISPKKITKAMQKTAIDMDDPRTAKFDKGFDFATGAGFLKADDAIARAIQIGSNNGVARIDDESNSRLKVYPNPSNGRLTFTWGLDKNKKSTLSIYNSMGFLLEEFQNKKVTQLSNDFSHYPSGIYIAKLVASNTSEVTRFVINK